MNGSRGLFVVGTDTDVGKTAVAVAIVAEPSSTAPLVPWLQLAAAHVGRATPCFRYDPDALRYIEPAELPLLP